MWLGRVWLFVSCLAFGACQSGGAKVEKSIGPAGGTVEAADGTSVTIPPGALAQEVMIGVSVLANAQAPRGATLLGAVYLMTPEGQRFDKPVRVKVAWDMARLPMGRSTNEAKLYTAGNAPNALLAALPTSTVEGAFVAADSDHFSLFLAAVPDGMSPGGNLDGGTNMCPLMVDTQGACGQCLRDNCNTQYTTCYGANWDKGDATGGNCGSFLACNCACNENETCLAGCMANLPPACTACQDAVSACDEQCLGACSQ